jgi:hypothetical protein
MIAVFVILGLVVLGLFLWWLISDNETVVVTETVHVHHQAPRATGAVRPSNVYTPAQAVATGHPRHTTQTVVTERVVYQDTYVDPLLEAVVAAEIIDDMIDPVVVVDDGYVDTGYVDDSYVDTSYQDTSYDDSIDYGNNDSTDDWN